MSDENSHVPGSETTPQDMNELMQKLAVGEITMTKEEFELKAKEAGWTDSATFAEDSTARASDEIYGGAAAVYSWQDEFGDVGPEVQELEEQLYGSEFQMRSGAHLANLQLTVTVEGPTPIAPFRRFEEAGLHPVVLENIRKCGYSHPTPIQAYTIPAVNAGKDVVAVAQTGSGKTSAYLIPIVSQLMGKAMKLRTRSSVATPLVLIIVPTRELAVQIFDEARRLTYRSMLRPGVAYGGFPMRTQRDELRKGCDVLIATPGRLKHLMEEPETLSMSKVKYTVIDEADELLASDWAEELDHILRGGDSNENPDHTYLMFSATFPRAQRELASEWMSEDDYVQIRVGRAGQTHRNIDQVVVNVDRDMKQQATFDLLYSSPPARTIIFCNSIITVDKLDDFLYNKGLPTTAIHSDHHQIEREDAMRAFKTGRRPILIATGVSARGWDIKDVSHVINYDLPQQQYGGITEYIHRIGRTGRIGHRGMATSFYNERDEDISADLANTLKEMDQDVPDFLQQYLSEDGQIRFGDDAEEAGEEAGEDGGAAVDGDDAASAGEEDL